MMRLVTDRSAPTRSRPVENASGEELEALWLAALTGELTAEERDFPFRGSHRFADPESSDQVTADATTARTGFLQQFAQAQRQLRARLAGSGIRHAVHYLDQPGDAALRALFGTRAAAERGESEGT